MTLQLTGRHLEITDAIRSLVTEKIAKISRHTDHVTAVHVILSIENHLHYAEAKVDIAGAQVFAKVSDHDMYAAIDLLIKKIDRQLIKHKEKIKNHHHTGVKLIIEDEE